MTFRVQGLHTSSFSLTRYRNTAFSIFNTPTDCVWLSEVCSTDPVSTPWGPSKSALSSGPRAHRRPSTTVHSVGLGLSRGSSSLSLGVGSGMRKVLAAHTF